MAKKSEIDSRSPLNKKMVDDLYEPFPENKIKERKGRAGQTWKYVEAAEMINRLNQVFGIRWSSEEVSSRFEPAGKPSHIVKRVRITVPDPDDASRTWWREGSASHPLFDNRGNAYDPGDCHKSAESKAFVKAASKLGVALHLWGVSGEVDDGVDSFVTPWGGPNDFAASETPVLTQGPQVTVVNPGPHNSVPPQLVNPGAINNSPPYNYNPNVGGAPLPQMINPNVGMTQGAGTAAAAQVTLQTQPVTLPQSGSVPVQEFQVGSIKGVAASRGMTNPLQLVSLALGDEAATIQAVEMLSFDQALRVLDYIRNTQTNSF